MCVMKLLEKVQQEASFTVYPLGVLVLMGWRLVRLAFGERSSVILILAAECC